MRRFAAMAAVSLAICWTATPLLACMIPERAMTAPEMECCKHMAQMCGSASMAKSHPCCKKEVRPGTTLAVTHNQQARPILQVVVTLPVPLSPPCSNRFHDSTSDHPPNEYPPETTVLRV